MEANIHNEEPDLIMNVLRRQARADSERVRVINEIMSQAITEAAEELLSDHMTAPELCLYIIQMSNDGEGKIQYYTRRGNVFYFRNLEGKTYKVWLSNSLSSEFRSSIKRNQFIN